MHYWQISIPDREKRVVFGTWHRLYEIYMYTWRKKILYTVCSLNSSQRHTAINRLSKNRCHNIIRMYDVLLLYWFRINLVIVQNFDAPKCTLLSECSTETWAKCWLHFDTRLIGSYVGVGIEIKPLVTNTIRIEHIEAPRKCLCLEFI